MSRHKEQSYKVCLESYETSYIIYSQMTKRINDFSRFVLSLCQCFSAAVHHLSTVNPARCTSCGMIGTFILCKKLSELQLLSSTSNYSFILENAGKHWTATVLFYKSLLDVGSQELVFFSTNSELLNPTFYMTEIIFLNSYLSFTESFYQTWE